MSVQAYSLDKAVLDICNANFKLLGGKGKKTKGDCGECPIKLQCLKGFSSKKMGTLHARNAALNSFVIELNRENEK